MLKKKVPMVVMPVIPALGRLRQEDGKFQASLGSKKKVLHVPATKPPRGLVEREDSSTLTADYVLCSKPTSPCLPEPQFLCLDHLVGNLLMATQASTTQALL
jgi:hypothetical protein